MDMEFGGNIKMISKVINLLAYTKMIKRMAMVNFIGNQETFIKVIMLRMKGKDMVK
jgi:hypothetical protein